MRNYDTCLWQRLALAAGGRSATLAEPSRFLDVRAGLMMPVIGVAGPGTAGTDAVAAQHLRGGPANAHPTPENCGRLAFAERRLPSWIQVGIAFGSGPAWRHSRAANRRSARRVHLPMSPRGSRRLRPGGLPILYRSNTRLSG